MTSIVYSMHSYASNMATPHGYAEVPHTRKVPMAQMGQEGGGYMHVFLFLYTVVVLCVLCIKLLKNKIGRLAALPLQLNVKC